MEQQQQRQQQEQRQGEASAESSRPLESYRPADAHPLGERAVVGAGHLRKQGSSSGSGGSRSRSGSNKIWDQWQKRAKGRQAISEAAAAEGQSQRSWDWRTQMTERLEAIHKPCCDPQGSPWALHGCFSAAGTAADDELESYGYYDILFSRRSRGGPVHQFPL